MKYEYKSISLTPDGIRVKGDDVSEKLASMIDKECSRSFGRRVEIDFHDPVFEERRSCCAFVTYFREGIILMVVSVFDSNYLARIDAYDHKNAAFFANFKLLVDACSFSSTISSQ